MGSSSLSATTTALAAASAANRPSQPAAAAVGGGNTSNLVMDSASVSSTTVAHVLLLRHTRDWTYSTYSTWLCCTRCVARKWRRRASPLKPPPLFSKNDTHDFHSSSPGRVQARLQSHVFPSFYSVKWKLYRAFQLQLDHYSPLRKKKITHWHISAEAVGIGLFLFVTWYSQAIWSVSFFPSLRKRRWYNVTPKTPSTQHRCTHCVGQEGLLIYKVEGKKEREQEREKEGRKERMVKLVGHTNDAACLEQ